MNCTADTVQQEWGEFQSWLLKTWNYVEVFDQTRQVKIQPRVFNKDQNWKRYITKILDTETPKYVET